MAMSYITQKCSELLFEIRVLEAELADIDELIGGPGCIRESWPDGMPDGTNDPIAAIFQRDDMNDILDQIESKYCLLDQLTID